MLFRINQKNLLLHMLDYFTREELLSLDYVVIGVGITVRGKIGNVSRSANDIYPSVDTITNYSDSPELFRKAFCSELTQNREHAYRNVIEPIIVERKNLVLVCIETQDEYLSIFLEWLEKHYHMKCIDLNRLFTEGETDIFSIDRKEVKALTEKLRREANDMVRRFSESTVGGRRKLVREVLSKKEKIKLLGKLGISVSGSDRKHLDEILEESWVNQSDD